MLLALLLAALPAVKIVPAEQAASIAPSVAAGRASVVHYWAVWCAACMKEWPRLSPELKRIARRGVAVATVSLDPKEKAAGEVPRTLARFGAEKFPAFLLDALDPDPVADAIDKAWDGVLPATFVYDRNGRRVASFFGEADRSALRAAVEQALAR